MHISSFTRASSCDLKYYKTIYTIYVTGTAESLKRIYFQRYLKLVIIIKINKQYKYIIYLFENPNSYYSYHPKFILK